MTQTIFIIAAFLLTYAGVEILRRWTVRRRILDIPNERSSHKTPTPRGGGLVIVTVAMLFYAVQSFLTDGYFSYGYAAGAVLIAAVSWFDDLKTVSSALRFAVHAVAAGLAISSLGFWNALHFPIVGEIELKAGGIIITFFWIIWLTNAYNFMDGIDGIAATQALTAGIGWLLTGIILGSETLAFYGGVIAFSSLGFLFHNWSPARIFMGDVGSAFLGYTFAVLPLIAARETQQSRSPLLATAAILFVWLFVFDTLYTFFRRLRRGEKFWRAHRSHLYQRLVIAGYSHPFVTIVYGLLSSMILAAGLFWIAYGDGFGWIPILSVIISSVGIVIFARFSRNS